MTRAVYSNKKETRDGRRPRARACLICCELSYPGAMDGDVWCQRGADFVHSRCSLLTFIVIVGGIHEPTTRFRRFRLRPAAKRLGVPLAPSKRTGQFAPGMHLPFVEVRTAVYPVKWNLNTLGATQRKNWVNRTLGQTVKVP